MALTYDFDMVAVRPEGLPDGFGDLEATGLAAERVAMFRDPKTVAALQSADPAVRDFFTRSGFALKPHNSGAPPGHYAASDEGARVALIQRLSTNLSAHDLRGANWGGFDFPDFMAALNAAEPVDETLLAPTSRNRFDPDLMAAQLASRKRRGRRLIAFGLLMLGLILLVYAGTTMMPQ